MKTQTAIEVFLKIFEATRDQTKVAAIRITKRRRVYAKWIKMNATATNVAMR